MDIKKLAAQVVFPRLDIDKYEENQEYKDYIHELTQIGVGGFCVFGGNTKSVENVLNIIQTHAQIPLIFCADLEYGMPMRLSDGNEFPHAMSIGKSGDANNAFKIGKSIAKEAKSIGIHWNLAPVVDVNSNALNPIINIRSFGEDIDTVSKFSGEFIRGSLTENVATCAKHFPGHGDTNVDSHLEMPYLTKSIEELEQLELKPFRNAVLYGANSIMIGHLSVNSIEPKNIPASLSRNIVQYLRNELKYRGILLTDALDMKAITNTYNAGEAALLSINAGNNIALMPEFPNEAINTIASSAQKDDNLLNHLKESERLLIKLKRFVGLIPQFATLESGSKTFMEHQKTALNIAHMAIEISGNEAIIPLNTDIIFAGFAYLQKEEDMRAASRFFTMLAQATENDCDFAFIDRNLTDENIELFKEGIEDAEVIVFPVFVRSKAYHGTLDSGEIVNNLIHKIADKRKTVVILFGSPYLEADISCDLLLKAYSDSFPSIAAAVVKLSGREAALKA